MEKDKLKDGELISMIRLRGIKPTQVYTSNEIFDDEGFRKRIQSEVDYQLYLKEQEIDDEVNKQLNKEIEEDKLKENENELIPGPDPTEKEPEKEKKKKPDDDENDMIPDIEGDERAELGDDNDLIPD